MNKPKCPACGHRLRVKPGPRTIRLALWQCMVCLKTKPPVECEFTNAMVQIAEDERLGSSDSEIELAYLNRNEW
jgi:hypothetical protein